MRGWTRRRFLGTAAVAVVGAATPGVACTGGGGDGGAAPTSPSTTTTTPASTTTTDPPEGPDPFTLGVASGEPRADSVLLWTYVDRPESSLVAWELATDPQFGEVVAQGVARSRPSAGQTLRVVVRDLIADTEYWYRFTLDGHRTAVGRTRTTPVETNTPLKLVVAQLSCQRMSSGYWTALDDVAAERPDLVIHTGDYVYETDTDTVRPTDAPPATDLESYRALWRRYRAEPSLQAAHAVAPWVMIWDDHEVMDNYQGPQAGRVGGPLTLPPDPAFLARRAAAYRAWWEFTPNRLPRPEGPDLPMYHVLDWGRLIRVVLLDTRQYRSPQPCGGSDAGPRCAGSDDVTMLGAEQEEWAASAIAGHDARWTAVVSSVVLHQWRFTPGNVVWNLDQWDGYPAARRRLLGSLREAPNPVVLSGDVHSSWVADVTVDPDGEPRAAPIAVEFVGPAVSSKPSSLLAGRERVVQAQSPHIRWAETRRRGWVRHEITAEEWTARYRLVEDADRPDTPVSDASEWRVTFGVPGVRMADEG